MDGLLDRLQRMTETCLTKRKMRKYAKAHRERTFKGELADWAESLVFAVVAVFFVSLYFFQLYVVPSSSMETTLMAGDRVGVSKRAYGTELCAFGPKTDSRAANRGDVVVFYNPDYRHGSLLGENLSNALFLLTFSLYNPSKEGKLFVKRAVGMPGDTVSFRDGDAFVRGFSRQMAEAEGFSGRAPFVRRARTVSEEKLSRLRGAMAAYDAAGLHDSIPAHLDSPVAASLPEERMDFYTALSANAEQVAHIRPYSVLSLGDWNMYENGIYVNRDHILPLGDNRDNSADGRFFGPVSMRSVIGKCVFRFWPLGKFKFLNASGRR